MAETTENNQELYVNEKVKKWSDPEYKKKYFREYYHKKKQLKGTYTGWTNDTEKLKEYRRNYNNTKGQEEVECPTCKINVKRVYLSYHNLHSKIHKLLASRQNV